MHQAKLSVANPPPRFLEPSRPGEYPRARTFTGRNSVSYLPDSIPGVIAAGLRVRIGYRENAAYMVILEAARRRKGLLDTLTAVRPQMAALVASARGEGF